MSPGGENKASEQALRSRIGRTVGGRWHLDALVGIGGMAAVYRATHKNGRQVAIKILNPELAARDEVKERFLEEGYAANRVGHPGTVAVFDDGTDESGCAYLVMELLRGHSFESLRERSGGRLAEKDAVSMAIAVCEVLEAAHARGIVHRDIKPENVFLTESGDVKLLDFGIARVTDTRRRNRTQSGVAMGTPSFMAPEQARGRWDLTEARTDVFALGATLYALLVGHPVHQAETIPELLLAAMTKQVHLAESSGVSAPLAEVINRALRFDPEERQHSAAELKADLEMVLEAGNLSLSPLVIDPVFNENSEQPTLPDVTPAPRKRVFRPAVGIAGALGACAAALTFVLSGPAASVDAAGRPAMDGDEYQAEMETARASHSAARAAASGDVRQEPPQEASEGPSTGNMNSLSSDVAAAVAAAKKEVSRAAQAQPKPTKARASKTAPTSTATVKSPAAVKSTAASRSTGALAQPSSQHHFDTANPTAAPARPRSQETTRANNSQAKSPTAEFDPLSLRR